MNSQVSTIGHVKLEVCSAEEIPSSLLTSIKNFVRDNSFWSFLINLEITIEIIVLLLFRLPVIFRYLGATQRKIHMLYFNKLKGGRCQGATQEERQMALELRECKPQATTASRVGLSVVKPKYHVP